ncbi:hypothetical protein ACEUEC_11665 [Aeromonas veronii]|uniref:hypothetical protein n=1 Tax=Aeromonas TaxID=642 RepID=UPI002B468D80|nr:hypothetical protein [Aeromonas caviae]
MSDKIVDVTEEIEKKYIPIFEEVFSVKFTLRKDIHKRIWYFESDTFSFGIGYTFTNGKTLEQIKSELTKGLETGKYNQDEVNIL